MLRFSIVSVFFLLALEEVVAQPNGVGDETVVPSIAPETNSTTIPESIGYTPKLSDGKLEARRNDVFLKRNQNSCSILDTWRGCGDYWELVNAADVANDLTYSEGRSDLPICMQGLVWMDQKCTSEKELPGFTCNPGFALNEYLVGFESWDGKCFTFRQDSWTFGSSSIARGVCSGVGYTFCQTNSDTHSPCGDGAYFKGPGVFDIEKTSFGWDRVSGGFSHYPVLPVVDWQGQTTKWFDNYLAEVSATECPASQRNCRLNQWASTKQTARCLGSTRGTIR
jgi:hypothetical protein